MSMSKRHGGQCCCRLCEEAADYRMWVEGEYDPRADPLFDHTAPPPVDRIARDGGYQWDGHFVEVPGDAS